MKKGEKADKTIRNIARIVKFIELNPDTHLNQIARNLKLHPYTVHRCLKQINEFLITKSYKDQVEGLANPPVLLKLKEGVTAEGIIRYLKVKDKLNI